MKKYLLLAAGVTSLSAGVVGCFVPVLPTTPFLLLAAACFLRSSRRLFKWLIGHRYLGTYISNYLTYRAVTRKAKIISITLLWLVLGSSILFAVQVWWVRLILVGVGCGVTIHLAIMRTLTAEMIAASRRNTCLEEHRPQNNTDNHKH